MLPRPREKVFSYSLLELEIRPMKASSSPLPATPSLAITIASITLIVSTKSKENFRRKCQKVSLSHASVCNTCINYILIRFSYIILSYLYLILNEPI